MRRRGPCSPSTPSSIRRCSTPAGRSRAPGGRSTPPPIGCTSPASPRVLVELACEASDARPRRPPRRADARHPGLPGDRGRRLAEAQRPRRDLSGSLRRRGRQARHQARRRHPVRGTARLFRQGGARDRGPPLLQPLRHRRRRHDPRAHRQREGRRASSRAARRSPSNWPRTSSSPTSGRSSARSRKPTWRCGSSII